MRMTVLCTFMYQYKCVNLVKNLLSLKNVKKTMDLFCSLLFVECGCNVNVTSKSLFWGTKERQCCVLYLVDWAFLNKAILLY